jgi:hypothetical protein
MSALLEKGYTYAETPHTLEFTCPGCGESFIFSIAATFEEIDKERETHRQTCPSARLITRNLHAHNCQCGRRFNCGSISCELEDDSEKECYACRDRDLLQGLN